MSFIPYSPSRISGAGQDLFLIEDYCLDHAGDGGGGGVEGAARLEQIDNLRAAVDGALYQPVDSFRGRSSVSGLPLTVVSRGMTTISAPCSPRTQEETSGHRYLELGGDEGAEAGAIEDAGHTHTRFRGNPLAFSAR